MVKNLVYFFPHLRSMQNSREGESPAAELALENKPITEYMVGPAPLEGTNFDEDWACYRDDDVIRQQDAIQAVEAEKIPLVGDKVRFSLDFVYRIHLVKILYTNAV